MWITFKSCIFAFWNNKALSLTLSRLVVNYIQILYLCILKQLYSEDAVTRAVVNYIQILYLCILKQLPVWFLCDTNVVNYIQILYLCILKQLFSWHFTARISCELHSNLVSLHSETTFRYLRKSVLMVVNYIQILYLCILKQQVYNMLNRIAVVNYIQILYLCILKQQHNINFLCLDCCELHSNLVSLHSETTVHLG